MKKYIGLLVIFSIVTLSCEKTDLCEAEITYTKGIGIYANLSSFRSNEINSPARLLEDPVKIFLSGDIMLIGERDEGIHVIDNSDPANPNFVNFLDVPGSREMAILGNRLFVDSYYDMLEIDISNPLQAQLVNRLEEVYPVHLRDDSGNALIDFEIGRVTEIQDCSYSSTLR